MKKISIIGATFTGNHGSEAMLTSTIMRIREQFNDTEFNVFSYYPYDDKKVVHAKWIHIFSSTPTYLFGIIFPCSVLFFLLRQIFPSFAKSIVPASIVALADSDILIDLAGVSFMDGREKFLPFNVLTILPSFLLNVPVVKFSQAMGPFNNVINRKCAAIFLHRCKKIFARGETTYKNIVNLAARIPVSLAADVAFLHRMGDSLVQNKTDHLAQVLKEIDVLKISSKRLIGICPSSLVAEKAAKAGIDYPIMLSLVAKRLVEKGYKVVIFPNSSRKNAKGKYRNNDLPVVSLIAKSLQYDESCRGSFAYYDRVIDADGIKMVISKCDIVVTSRFHAMVGAFSLGVPVFIIGWGHKYFEVLDQFKQSLWVCDWAEANQYVLLEKILLLLQRLEEEKQIIISMIPNAEELSTVQLRYVFDHIGGENA